MKQTIFSLFFFAGILSFSVLHAQKSKPGDLAPNAKVLDVDVMEPFNKGAAIVRKGNLSGLIDTAGNFLVPFNRYNFLTPTNKNAFGSGLFVTLEGAVINYKGQMVASNAQFKGSGFDFTEDGQYCASSFAGKKTMYVDAEGNHYTTSVPITAIYQGVGIAGKHGIDDGKRYFLTLDNQRITAKTYLTTEAFSDGLALVSGKDAYGVVKYGFINRQGQEVFPLKFSNAPTSFRYGISIVTPADVSEFRRAYINKQGQVIFKETPATLDRYSGVGEFQTFWHGFIFSTDGKHIMDTTGRIFTVGDLMKKFGTDDKTYFLSELSPTWEMLSIDDDKIRVKINDGLLWDKKKMAYGLNSMGFLDLKTGKMVEAAFANYNPALFHLVFDKTAKLAYAERCIGEGTTGVPLFRKGYINEEGVFVMVMAPGSTW